VLDRKVGHRYRHNVKTCSLLAYRPSVPRHHCSNAQAHTSTGRPCYAQPLVNAVSPTPCLLPLPPNTADNTAQTIALEIRPLRRLRYLLITRRRHEPPDLNQNRLHGEIALPRRDVGHPCQIDLSRNPCQSPITTTTTNPQPRIESKKAEAEEITPNSPCHSAHPRREG